MVCSQAIVSWTLSVDDSCDCLRLRDTGQINCKSREKIEAEADAGQQRSKSAGVRRTQEEGDDDEAEAGAEADSDLGSADTCSRLTLASSLSMHKRR